MEEAFRVATDIVFAQAIEVAMPHLHALDLPAVDVAWCRHVDGPYHFVLVFKPDGPCVGLQPLDTAAEEFLLAHVPGAVPYRDRGVSTWASAQHWQFLASMRFTREQVTLRMGLFDAPEDD